MSEMPAITRRDFLWRAGGGFGSVALTHLLGSTQVKAGETATLRTGLHHPAKAKRVVHLFMNGGVSHLDTFDHKPRLKDLDGQRFDPGAGQLVESVTRSPGFKVMRSPFDFKQYGRCGRWVSQVFPHMATLVDDLAFILSMHSPTNVHGLGSYMQNTGYTLPGFPCVGAWISYALGRINENLPAFVVMPDPRGLPYNNLGNFTSGFLPIQHQGTVIHATGDRPIPYLFPPEKARHVTPETERAGRRLLRRLNANHLREHRGESLLAARIASYEMAARLQLSAPEVFDLSRETEVMKARYGLNREETADFGRRCLIARRMLERDVRFIQIWSGAGGPKNNWDNHANIPKELPWIARQVDQPIRALLQDLKATGLLNETVVVWTTEFGRMPFSQGQAGRDHNGGSFVTWLAGAGIAGGVAVGESDVWGWKAVQEYWCYDLHATLLHLLGIDHERLTFRHNGLDRRLTDVHGRVIHALLG